MSPGIRSGVNWTRLVRRESGRQRAHQEGLRDAGDAFEQHVARQSSAMTMPVTAASCPTTAFATSVRTASSAARKAAGSGPAPGVAEPGVAEPGVAAPGTTNPAEG